MISKGTIWSILRLHVPRRQWVSANEICSIVELYAHLDEDDRRPRSGTSKNPRWKTLVWNVLADRAKKGTIRRRDHC